MNNLQNNYYQTKQKEIILVHILNRSKIWLLLYEKDFKDNKIFNLILKILNKHFNSFKYSQKLFSLYIAPILTKKMVKDMNK